MPAAPSQRDLAVNGINGINSINLRVTELGFGPSVLLCHGWPELAHSRRHPIAALAAALSCR